MSVCCVCVLCRQALSARDVHEIADAAVRDGCPSADLVTMSKLGTNGTHPGNLYRDLLRMSRRKIYGGMLSVYDVDTVVQNPDVTSQPLQMLLPHEWFSALYHKDKDLFHKVMGTETCKEFWTRMAACDEPWLKHHEYRREVEADPARRAPKDFWRRRCHGQAARSDGPAFLRNGMPLAELEIAAADLHHPLSLAIAMYDGTIERGSCVELQVLSRRHAPTRGSPWQAVAEEF